MKSYGQLRYEERVKIAQLWQLKFSISQIAQEVSMSKSTISREIRRNQAPPGQYWPETAQGRPLRRRQLQCRLDQDRILRETVLTKLQCHYWTPEQIAGWLKHRQTDIAPVSH